MSVSVSKEILEEIDVLIKGLDMFRDRSGFVEEACLEKIRVEKIRLNEIERLREDYRHRSQRVLDDGILNDAPITVSKPKPLNP